MAKAVSSCSRCRQLSRRLFLQGLVGGLGALVLENALFAAPASKAKKKAAPVRPPDTSVLDETIVGAYAKRAWQTIEDWQTLGTPEARGADLGAAVQLALEMAHVPAAKGIIVIELEKPRWAQFDAESWVLSLDPIPLGQDAPSRQAAIELLALVYHECRHTQQFWRIIRRLAAWRKAKKILDIQRHFNVPDELAALALACPIGREDPSAAQAEDWFEHRNDSQIALKETQKEMQRLGMHSPSDNPAAYEEIRAKYLSYPLEADAHEGYHRVKRLLTGGAQP